MYSRAFNNLITSTNILRDYDQSLFADPNKDGSGKGRGNEGNEDKKGKPMILSFICLKEIP
ncbi:MAG TPA: hypothetical protein VJS91_06920 [Nitrososphaeraceae archaeon]|nr:hypothetical protein [Nitrososphaeraceae archaeon]